MQQPAHGATNMNLENEFLFSSIKGQINFHLKCWYTVVLNQKKSVLADWTDKANSWHSLGVDPCCPRQSWSECSRSALLHKHGGLRWLLFLAALLKSSGSGPAVAVWQILSLNPWAPLPAGLVSSGCVIHRSMATGYCVGMCAGAMADLYNFSSCRPVCIYTHLRESLRWRWVNVTLSCCVRTHQTGHSRYPIKKTLLGVII